AASRRRTPRWRPTGRICPGGRSKARREQRARPHATPQTPATSRLSRNSLQLTTKTPRPQETQLYIQNTQSAGARFGLVACVTDERALSASGFLGSLGLRGEFFSGRGTSAGSAPHRSWNACAALR